MTEQERLQAELALRAVAARANKLANDVANNRLWPGELATGVQQMKSDLTDVSA